MSLTCELSGLSLAGNSPNNDDEVVVTPSGHVCWKRLLLSKLAETGGRDPFDSNQELSEDQLVTLKLPSSAASSGVVPPRTASVTSVPSLLQTLQSDYDALVLELFDTRQLLEQTRRELSQALYENDAAVRVVARVAQERDAARQQLQQWNISAAEQVEAEAEQQEPALKKPRLDEPAEPKQELPLQNSIPEADLQQMMTTWQELHQGRKARQKQAAAAAPSAEQIAQYTCLDNATTSWHKSNAKGLTAMASHGNIIVSAGKSNKELVLYDLDQKVVLASHVLAKTITCVDVNESFVVAGCKSSGLVEVFSNDDTSTRIGSVHLQDSDKIVDVRLFPDQVHLVAASESGNLTLCRIESDSDKNSQVTPIAVLKQQQEEQESKYTCGALHPDGLIYLAGTSTGQVLIWDLKSQSLAGVLKSNDNDNDDNTNAILQVQISNNGYHIAAATSTSVRVWDLRKQKQLAMLQPKDDDNNKLLLESIESVAFDDSGKYLAYGGSGGGVCITTVKEWGVTPHFMSASGKKKYAIHNLVWTQDNHIAASSQKQRNVDFFGVPAAKDNEQQGE